MTVFGVDPGTASLGWGIVASQGGRIELGTFGVIHTPPAWDMPRRLLHIFESLCQRLSEHRPDVMAVESIFATRNHKTVITVSQARGVALLAAASSGIPVAEYGPLQVKQAVVGYGRAEKRQVQQMLRHVLLGLDGAPESDDAADALAVAYCHIQRTPGLRVGAASLPHAVSRS